MGHALTLPGACDRTRRFVTLDLDGELSQVEHRLMERHLAACAGCRSYAAELAVLTNVLRTAALERLERPVQLPRLRGRASLRIQTAGAAAAAAAAVLVAAVGLGTALRVEDDVRPDDTPGSSVTLTDPPAVRIFGSAPLQGNSRSWPLLPV